MMLSSRPGIVSIAFLLAFAFALATGYRIWRSRGASSWKVWLQRLSLWRGEEALQPARAAFPFVVGLYLGILALGIGLETVVQGDRFYPPDEAVSIKASLQLALLLLMLRTVAGGGGGIWWRMVLPLSLELGAAALVVANGVRFEVVGFGAGGTMELGALAAPLTILWLLAAMYAVRLLDGIDGAVPVLLLTAAVAVLVATRGTNEYLLAALCVVIIGAVLGSLRFHFFPARLPLRGAATGIFGFVFAVLTVLARQKTVAALLLIFPLAVILLLLGGAMLGLLEKTLLLPDRASEGKAEEEKPGEPER